jgi:hypothetical protein
MSALLRPEAACLVKPVSPSRLDLIPEDTPCAEDVDFISRLVPEP